MFAWWNVLESAARVNVWAQYLTILFLCLSAVSGAVSFTASKRIASLKLAKAVGLAREEAPKAEVQVAPAPVVAPPAPVAAPPAPVVAVPEAPKAVAAAPVQNLPAPPKAVVPSATQEMAIPAKAPAAPAKVAADQRHLTKDQKDKLSSLLAGRPKGQVSVTYMVDDFEAKTFCDELVGVLDASGWKAVKTGPTAQATNPKGLHFQIKSPAHEPENAKYLIHSFLEAGIKPSTELNKAVPDATLLLIVGHKP